jgi:hypothetical protein
VSKKKPSDAVAIISYDDKPGIQAIATTAPDLPPKPGVHATFAREPIDRGQRTGGGAHCLARGIHVLPDLAQSFRKAAGIGSVAPERDEPAGSRPRSGFPVAPPSALQWSPPVRLACRP